MDADAQNVVKESPGKPAAPEPIRYIGNSDLKGCGNVVGRSTKTTWWGKWQVLIAGGSAAIAVSSAVIVYARNTDPDKIATKEFVLTHVRDSEKSTTDTIEKALIEIRVNLRQQAIETSDIKNYLLYNKMPPQRAYGPEALIK